MPSPFCSPARVAGSVVRNQVQTMVPVAFEQVFDESACEPVAVQEGGGPVTAVATIVTSFEGVKPLTAAAFVAVPEK
jgi:hypothetical protein